MAIFCKKKKKNALISLRSCTIGDISAERNALGKKFN